MMKLSQLPKRQHKFMYSLHTCYISAYWLA